MNIVFMGTPDFATGCLTELIQAGHTILGVFTQPDKPKGRGYQMSYSAVKEVALKYDLPIYQPKTFKTGEAQEILQKLNPDVIVVVAYGKILPKAVLELPKYGCINVHASLLPKYRGAGPIQWCVIDGEKTTGVTTMHMAEGLDTGDMILKNETPIGENETAGQLHDRLAQMGATLICETLKQLEAGTAPREKQDDSLSNYAPMLSKELCAIDFSKSAKQIHNQIRGLSPWPVATTCYKGKTLKIHEARLCDGTSDGIGVLCENKKMVIGCGDGKCIEFLTVQYEGAKRMDAGSFMNGHRMKAGEILGK